MPSTPKSSPVAFWMTRTRRISIGVPVASALPQVAMSELATGNFRVVGSTLPAMMLKVKSLLWVTPATRNWTLSVLPLLESGLPGPLSATPDSLREKLAAPFPGLIETLPDLVIWMVAAVVEVGSVRLEDHPFAAGAACATPESPTALARIGASRAIAFIG